VATIGSPQLSGSVSAYSAEFIEFGEIGQNESIMREKPIILELRDIPSRFSPRKRGREQSRLDRETRLARTFPAERREKSDEPFIAVGRGLGRRLS